MPRLTSRMVRGQFDFDAPQFTDFSDERYQRRRALLEQLLFAEQSPLVDSRTIDGFTINDLPSDFEEEDEPTTTFCLNVSSSNWFERPHPSHEPSSPASPPGPLLTPSPAVERQERMSNSSINHRHPSSAAKIDNSPLNQGIIIPSSIGQHSSLKFKSSKLQKPMRVVCSSGGGSRRTESGLDENAQDCLLNTIMSKSPANLPMSPLTKFKSSFPRDSKVSPKTMPDQLLFSSLADTPSPPKLQIDIDCIELDGDDSEPSDHMTVLLPPPIQRRMIGGGGGAARVILEEPREPREPQELDEPIYDEVSDCEHCESSIHPINNVLPPSSPPSHNDSPLLKRIRVGSRFTPVPAELPHLLSLSRRASLKKTTSTFTTATHPYGRGPLGSGGQLRKDRPVKMDELKRLLDAHNKRVRGARR